MILEYKRFITYHLDISVDNGIFLTHNAQAMDKQIKGFQKKF